MKKNSSNMENNQFATFAYLAATKLKPASNKVLMLFFASSANSDDKIVLMDIATIANTLGITERTVITATKELEEYGIIIKEQNAQDKRRFDYHLNPVATWKAPEELNNSVNSAPEPKAAKSKAKPEPKPETLGIIGKIEKFFKELFS